MMAITQTPQNKKSQAFADGTVSHSGSSIWMRSQSSFSKHHPNSSIRCQCQAPHLAQTLISAQHQKIEDIQRQIDHIQRDLRWLKLGGKEDTHREELKDKVVTLHWSLSDQKERLEALNRKLHDCLCAKTHNT